MARDDAQLRPSPAETTARDSHAPASKAAPLWLLRIDGLGAFLLTRASTVSLGPVSSAARPDIGLVGDPAMPAATIRRGDDGQYMLQADQRVLINQQPTARHLLRHGDRLGLAPRCRMRFEQPHPASTSAVIDLDGARMPRADVRRILLMGDSLILGPGSATHLRCDDLPDAVLITRRGEQLWWRPAQARHSASAAPQPIPIDTQTRIGGCSARLEGA